MKKISILIYMLSHLLFGSGCYMNYGYSDMHHIKTTIKQQIDEKEVNIVSTLYLRYIEENNNSYIIAWLKDPNREDETKDAIDTESIYAPFLIEKERKYPDGFVIKKLQLLSQDENIKQQLFGLMDILQFKNHNESYKALITNGKIEVDENLTSKGIHLSYGKLFTKNIKNEAITYNASNINIVPSNNCTIWNAVDATQRVEIEQHLLNINIIDNREFNLTRLDEKLDKNHWFLQLGTDIKQWNIGKAKTKLSLTEASALFTAKEQEIKALLGDLDKLEEWIKKNEAFLQYLDVLLEDNSLDDEVSKKLFSMLGYVDSTVTTNVLGRIVLNDKIAEKERFRAVMAFKNSSAPIDKDTLTDILEYGLSSDNGDDFIQNSLGMLLGTIAKERVNRVSDQAKQIEQSIIDTLQTKENKTISLAAAGNMLGAAPQNLIEAVDSVMLTSEDSYTRAKSANALSRIGKSGVTTKEFSTLIENETNTDAQSELIEASVSADGFNADNEFRTFLVKKAYHRKDASSNRVSALKTLLKTDYGKTQEEKKSIRKMMLGEKNSDIIKLLKTLYRR